MIGLGIQQIKRKILSEGLISEDELNNKIKAKLDQLSGLISEEGAAHIIANELGVKLFQAAEAGAELKVEDIAQGMRNVDVVGKITRKFELRTFQTAERQGKVASFILADETGSIRITLWNDQADLFANFNEGDVLRIKSGYVRNNNGRAEVHLNDRSKVEVNPSGVEIKAVESGGGSSYPKPTRKKLNELKEDEQNIEVLGTIVQVYDIRFFESCAECNKRLINKEGIWNCPTHGQVSPDYNYVMNTFVDDGTDSIRVTFWKRQIQTLLSKEDSEVQTFRTNPAAFEPLKTELLGNIVKLVGSTRMNQQMNSLEFSANLVFNNPDPNEELQRLKTEPQSIIKEVEEKPKLMDDNQKIEQTVENELNKVNSQISNENPSKIEEAIKQDLEENVIEEAPIIEQKPTPSHIGFETPNKPISERMDKTGIDDDLVDIEDLEDLEELDDI